MIRSTKSYVIATLDFFRTRPLSGTAVVLSVGLVIFPVYERLRGNIFIESLNYIDGTTLMMAGALLLRGIYCRRIDTDLQAVSIALIGCLSFVFAFEALYKLSFYLLPPFMPADELREFVIQTGISVTALTGFAFGRFVFSSKSKIFLSLFLVEWTFWLLVGFPQLFTDRLFYPAIIDMRLEWGMIYLLARIAKFTLFLVYFHFHHSGNVSQT